MKQRFTLVSAVAIAVLTGLLLPSSAAAEWQPVERIDGVDIYERDARYLGEIAMLGSIDTSMPMDHVVSVFIDPEQRTDWNYRTSDQEMLDVEEPTKDGWSEQYWTKVEMPMSIADRDYVVRGDYRYDAENNRLSAVIRSVEDPRKPEKECCVRARSLIHYTIEELPGGDGTRIRVVIESDIGGNISGALVRQAAPQWPAATLNNLVERAMESDIATVELHKWSDG